MNTPPEFLICICSSPESVVKWSLVDASNPVLGILLSIKGEMTPDIVKIHSVTGINSTATCY